MLVVTETLAALAAAHKLGVVHRDIKPSNILLDDGHTKITDFGIAKSFGVGGDPGRVADDMTMTGVVLGTPGYLAPERRSGQPATVQSDLYAVGAVMVEALTGRRLVPGPDATEHLPRPFRDIARAALAADPAIGSPRQPTCCRRWEPVERQPSSHCPRPRRWRRRRPSLAAVPLARGATKMLSSAASRAATNRAHPGPTSPDPRGCRSSSWLSPWRCTWWSGPTGEPEGRPP